jgi:predicted nucleic acid-binding protein
MLGVLGDVELCAPALMWSEARSALHLRTWRGLLSASDGETMRSRLEQCPVGKRSPARLGHEAWRIADEMGWARTCDAEYLALARLLGCRLVTLDARCVAAPAQRPRRRSRSRPTTRSSRVTSRASSPGGSYFLRDGDRVFHTYSNYGRGAEMTGESYYWLDLTALGRQEEWEQPKGRAASAHAATPDFAD